MIAPIAIAIALGLVAGLLVGRFARGGAGATAGAPSGREKPMKLVAADDKAATTLDALVEAVRAAALRVERRADGFDLIDSLDPAKRLAVRVLDRTWIPASALRCGDTASLDAPFVLAIALVPIYGALTVTVNEDAYVVDGTRDRHQMVRELSRRQTEKMRKALAARGMSL